MEKEMMPNFLIKRAFLTPDRTAVYFQDQRLTFKELYQRSKDTAAKLQSLGLKKDDYIGVLLKNHLDTVIIFFALQLLGVRAVILNNRLTSSEIAWQLNDSKAELLIIEPTFTDIQSDLITKMPKLPIVTKHQLFEMAGKEPVIQNEIDLSDICTIMYTSGTTGNPKGVIQTYGNHWWSSVGSALNLGFMENDCWLCSVPLFHISGFSILMRSVIYGMPIVLHENFDADRTLADIKDKKITIMSLVSIMLTRLVNTMTDPLPEGFRCMLLGGGPAPLPLLQACKEREIPIFQTYGMTETSSQIVTLSPEYSLSKLGSAGKPLFPSQVRIELEDKSIAPAGEPGEIVVKGPNVTSGYLFRPEATKEKLKDGWLYTGDIGYLDKDGFLYVLDRRSDLIISGGENIYPAELEAILLDHPNIAEAGVTGIEDPVWGQVPVAFIVLKNETGISEVELVQFCLSRLAKYKVPKKFYVTDILPRNASNKLLRRKLLDLIKEDRMNL